MSAAPSDELREVYERRAELQYAQPPPPPDRSLDRKFERVWELLSALMPCERFLDAGCGDGRHLAALASLPQRPARVAGVDISERILEVAGLTAAAAGVEAELVRANLEQLPFADRSFDLVLCTQVIEHLLEPALGLAELARVLEPGGRVLVTTDHRRNLVTRTLNGPRSAAVSALRLRGRRAAVTFPHRSFGLDEFARLVEGAGLEVEHRETFRFSLHPPLDRKAAVRALNRLDRRIGPHGVGDVIAVVARKRG